MGETTLEDRVMETLKPDINHFLFPKVPGAMTIAEFEDLTCEIYILVVKAWNKYTGPTNEPVGGIL